MKKILSILICIALLMSLTCVASAEGATVKVGSASAKAGEEVSVDLVLSNNTGFANIALEIEYNASVMSLTLATSQNVGATFTKAQSYDETPYNMSWDATENVSFNGTLATLTFKVNANAANGTYPVKVSYYKGREGNYTDGYDVNYDENFESLDLGYVNGAITVSNDEEPSEQPTEKPTENDGKATVSVEKVSCGAGEEVSVDLVLSNNTGFANIALEVEYDASVMSLTAASSENIGATFTRAQSYNENPFNMSWDAAENVTFNGTLATLTFKVNANAANGTYPVKVSYYKGREGNYTDGYDVNYDENFESLNLGYVNGEITVVSKETGIEQVEYVDKAVSVKLSGKIDGKVVVALYDENDILLESKISSASEVVNVTFEKTGSYIKVIWLEDISTIEPKCEAERIEVKN